MTKLAGAHVIVTGGSEGIGLATAQLAARRGATVSLIARRPDVLAEAAASIRGPVGTAAADVTDAAALATAIDGLVALDAERTFAEAEASLALADARIADAQGWGLGETLERAVELLQREHGSA